MSTPPKKKPYDVGYGKPPEHTRFQKGRSGNPKGRQKNTLNLATVLEAALSQTITASENGRPIRLTKLQALVLSNINRGLKSDARASKTVFDLMGRYGIGDAQAEASTAVSEDDDAILERYAASLLTRKSNKGE